MELLINTGPVHRKTQVLNVGAQRKEEKVVCTAIMNAAANAARNYGAIQTIRAVGLQKTLKRRMANRKTRRAAPHGAETSKSYKGLPKLSNFIAEKKGEMTYDATLNGHAVVGEWDHGAIHTFMSRKAADLCGLSVRKVDIEVVLGDNSSTKVSRIAKSGIEGNGYTCNQVTYILPVRGKYDGRLFIVSSRQWL